MDNIKVTPDGVYAKAEKKLKSNFNNGDFFQLDFSVDTEQHHLWKSFAGTERMLTLAEIQYINKEYDQLAEYIAKASERINNILVNGNTYDHITYDIENQIYFGNKDKIIYEFPDDYTIILEVIKYKNGNKAINVELQDENGNSIENAECKYDDMDEILSAYEYINNCRKDMTH